MIGTWLFYPSQYIITENTPEPVHHPIVKAKVINLSSRGSVTEVNSKPSKSSQEPVFYDGVLTAYYDAKDSMNGELGVTASGYNLDNGIFFQGYRILAADSSFKLGTLIDIKLKGGQVYHCIVLDRGGAIHDTHFDIVMGNQQDCFDFGKQKINWRKVGQITLGRN